MTTNPYGVPDTITPSAAQCPDFPDFDTIRAEITPRLEAGESPLVAEFPSLTLELQGCFYAADRDGIHTPIFDKPLTGDAGATIVMRLPDGTEQEYPRHGVEGEYPVSQWDWEDFAQHVDDFMDAWIFDAARARTWAVDAQRVVAGLEKQLAEAKSARDAAVRAAHAAGFTNYRIAKDLGISQPTVARILG